MNDIVRDVLLGRNFDFDDRDDIIIGNKRYTTLIAIIDVINIYNMNYADENDFTNIESHSGVIKYIKRNINPHSSVIKYIKSNIPDMRYMEDDDIIDFVENNIHESVERLLQRGADVNKPVFRYDIYLGDKEYPIMTAILRNKYITVMRLLIEYGADLTLRTVDDDDDFSSEIIAIIRDHRPKIDNYIVDICYNNTAPFLVNRTIYNFNSLKPYEKSSLRELRTELLLRVYEGNENTKDIVEIALFNKRAININYLTDILRLKLSNRLEKKIVNYMINLPNLNLEREYNKALTYNLSKINKEKLLRYMLDNNMYVRNSVAYDLLNSDIDTTLKERLSRKFRLSDVLRYRMPKDILPEIGKYID